MRRGLKSCVEAAHHEDGVDVGRHHLLVGALAGHLAGELALARQDGVDQPGSSGRPVGRRSATQSPTAGCPLRPHRARVGPTPRRAGRGRRWRRRRRPGSRGSPAPRPSPAGRAARTPRRRRRSSRGLPGSVGDVAPRRPPTQRIRRATKVTSSAGVQPAHRRRRQPRRGRRGARRGLSGLGGEQLAGPRMARLSGHAQQLGKPSVIRRTVSPGARSTCRSA